MERRPKHTNATCSQLKMNRRRKNIDRRFFVAVALAAFVLTTMCAFPAIAQQKRLSDETAKRFHVFPTLVDGGGWRSFLLVANVAQSTSRCTFELHGLTIDRFQDVGFAASGSTAAFELQQIGSYLVWGTRNELALASGYGTLDCSTPVVAQVLYVSKDGSGVTGMATVFSSQAGEIFQFPVLTADASLGFAVANDTADDASCRIVLQTYQGVNQGEAALSVPSMSNIAQFLHELIQIPEAFLGGSARISCDQQVSIIGLQFDGAIFTTLPPAIMYTRATPDLDRFQLFNECRPVAVSVEDLPAGAPGIGLTREAIHDAVELKLRSARLYNESDLLGDHLSVNVNYVEVSVNGDVLGTAFHVWVAFERWVSESISGESWYAPAWNSTVVGTTSTSTDTILQTVGQEVDSFVLEYLRVNQEACG